MIPLTNEHRNYMKRQKSTTFSRLIISTLMKKTITKLAIIVIILGNIEMGHVIYVI